MRRDGLHILREAAAAKAAARPQEGGGTRRLQLALAVTVDQVLHQVQALEHLGRIQFTDAVADPRDLVRERDHRGHEGIGGVLDHLGRTRRGLDDRRVPEHRVHLGQLRRAAGIDATHHDTVRFLEVLHGHAFGQELGVHAQAEVLAGHQTRGFLDGLAHHRVGRARDHRALDRHHAVMRLLAGGFCGRGLILQHLADLARDLQHVAQVDGLAIEGRTHADQRDIGAIHRVRQRSGRSQTCTDVGLQECFQTVLMDRRLTPIDALDLGCIHVDAGHLVPDRSQARSRHQTDVAGSHHTQFHHAASASRLK